MGSITQCKKVLMPLPATRCDPTEVAVPWNALTKAGHTVVFATPDKKPAVPDMIMMTGTGLPRLFRSTLKAEPAAVALCQKMMVTPEFQNPISYAEINGHAYDGLILAGGHDKGPAPYTQGMRAYLEDPILHGLVSDFFAENKPVGAICHGTLLVARSPQRDQKNTGSPQSVLFGRRTTGLTWAQEMTAYTLTRCALGDYYRTYPTPMATELKSFLQDPRHDYCAGPGWPVPRMRDNAAHTEWGFTVRDGMYLSARWPGDAHRFARDFVMMLTSP